MNDPPMQMDRAYEKRLVDLCASGDLEPARWAASGPPTFMAGLAVMLASAAGHERRGLLDLAETLHAGASLPETFALWLESSPVRPSRFLPLVAANIEMREERATSEPERSRDRTWR